MKTEKLYDVIAVNIATGEQRLMAERKDERNAEAIVNMAIMRRGIDEEFYESVEHPWVPPKT